MGLWNREINHATRVHERGSITAFFPYLSRSRAESVVYFTKQLDVTNATEFLNEKKRNGQNLSLFILIVTAISRTFAQRPMLNRFILGRRLYQRNVVDVSYVIKRSLTDLGDELLATVPIKEGSTLNDIAELMNKTQNDMKNKTDNGLDKLMDIFGHLPRPLMQFAFLIVRRLDFHGCIPAFIRNELPFYCSVFISNLGSIGVDAPYHHLYELGTTSFFLAIGKPTMQPVVSKEGTIVVRKIVNLNFTVDERICDGYYLARSLDRFIKYLEHPETI